MIVLLQMGFNVVKTHVMVPKIIIIQPASQPASHIYAHPMALLLFQYTQIVAFLFRFFDNSPAIILDIAHCVASKCIFIFDVNSVRFQLFAVEYLRFEFYIYMHVYTNIQIYMHINV